MHTRTYANIMFYLYIYTVRKCYVIYKCKKKTAFCEDHKIDTSNSTMRPVTLHKTSCSTCIFGNELYPTTVATGGRGRVKSVFFLSWLIDILQIPQVRLPHHRRGLRRPVDSFRLPEKCPWGIRSVEFLKRTNEISDHTLKLK